MVYGLNSMTANEKHRLVNQASSNMNDVAPMSDVMSGWAQKVKDFFGGALE
jgi:hypothetical protein